MGVPDGFDDDNVFKTWREIEISAMSLGAKFLLPFIRRAQRIKKTCVAVGVTVLLVSSSAVGVELDKKARAEFCKEQAAPIGQELRAFAAARGSTTRRR